jgi:two-component system osmolarity sensor histidine kinase EnvZ
VTASRVTRFDSLFVRLQLVQTGLIAMFCIVIGSLVYAERNATLAGLQADHWAPHLMAAAGLSAAEPSTLHSPIERRGQPPASAQRPSLPAPRYAALRQALRSRGVPVDDLVIEPDGAEPLLWLRVAPAGRPPVWLGVARRELVSAAAWRNLLTAVAAALLMACASGVLTHRLTRPLERLAQRLQHHAAGQAGKASPAGAGWQATAPEILSITKACAGLLASLQRHEREHAVLLKGLSGALLGAPLERARLAAQGLPPLPAIDDAKASILGDVVAAGHLVGNLLDYVSSSELALDESVDLADAARAVVARFARPEGELSLSAPETLVWPQANRLLVERLVANLVDNALKHGRPPVRVEVGAATSSAWVTVEDAGDGLDPKTAGRLLEAFTRGEGGLSGGGLGLAIVRLVATRLGGEVSFERGEGVQRVTVTLWTRPEGAEAA